MDQVDFIWTVVIMVLAVYLVTSVMNEFRNTTKHVMRNTTHTLNELTSNIIQYIYSNNTGRSLREINYSIKGFMLDIYDQQNKMIDNLTDQMIVNDPHDPDIDNIAAGQLFTFLNLLYNFNETGSYCQGNPEDKYKISYGYSFKEEDEEVEYYVTRELIVEDPEKFSGVWYKSYMCFRNGKEVERASDIDLTYLLSKLRELTNEDL